MAYLSYAQLNTLPETSFIAGSDFTLEFVAYQEDGTTPLDLSGATVEWVLSPFGQTDVCVLQVDGEITGDNTYKVVLGSNTAALSGKYIQQPIITSFAGKEYRPSQGVILILPAIPKS